MPFQVNKREHVYFCFSLVVSVVFYYFLCVSHARILTPMYMYMGVFCFYAIGIGIFLLFTHVVLIGHLRGNAIEITKDQLPEIYKILENQSQILKLSDTPTMFSYKEMGF